MVLHKGHSLKIKKSVLPGCIVLALLFFLGGVFQLLSVMSITETNLLVIAIIIIFLIANYRISELASLSMRVWPIFLYVAFLFFVSLYHHNSIIIFLSYSLTGIILLVVFLFSKSILCKDACVSGLTIKVFYLILILQVPVLLLQVFYGAYIIAFFNAKIALYDCRFGTFFIKSDSTLGLFANLLLIYILFQSKCKILNKKTIFFLFLIVFVVFVINSKLSKLVFIVVCFFYLLNKISNINKNLTISITFFVISFLIITICNVDLSGYMTYVEHERLRVAMHAEQSYAHIPRYAVLLLLFNKTMLLGNGLYDYYNYITKEWKFFAGHSLWFSLYNDTGPVGCILILWCYWKIFISSARIKLVGLAQFILAVLYSSISFLLYDAGAILLLTFFSCINDNEINNTDEFQETAGKNFLD